jgi:hypothetical protein
MNADIELDAQMTVAARLGVLDMLCIARGLPMSYAIARGRWYVAQPQAYRDRVLARAELIQAEAEAVMHELRGGKFH